MRALLLLCCITFTQLITAQGFNSNHKRYAGKFNYEALGKEEVLASWYHYVKTRTEEGAYVVRVFYPETGQITHRTHYANPALTVRHGAAMEWYDNGELRSVGHFEQGQASGFWVFRKYGGTREEGMMSHQGRQGAWTEWSITDRRLMDLHYEKGMRQGPFTTYDSLGQVRTTGRHEKGIAVLDSAYLSTSDPIPHIETLPRWPGCDTLSTEAERERCTEDQISAHLSRNLRYPKEAMNMEVDGRALFSFTVNKEGKVTDLVAQRGLCKAIEDECRRVIHTMPAWVPGTQNGKAVNVHYHLPFKFTLR